MIGGRCCAPAVAGRINNTLRANSRITPNWLKLSSTSLLGELKSRVGAKGSTEPLRLIEAPPGARIDMIEARSCHFEAAGLVAEHNRCIFDHAPCAMSVYHR